MAQITVLRGLSPTLLHDSIFKTQEEANLIFWLATQEVKIAPSCALGISRVSPARKSFFLKWPYNKSFIDRACSVRMADFYWPRLRLARSIKTKKDNLANIQASLTHALSTTHMYLTSPHRSHPIQYYTLPHFILPTFHLSYIILSSLSHLILARSIWHHPISCHLISSHLISPHPISSHTISYLSIPSHTTSPHIHFFFIPFHSIRS